jgi:hypothetical protein
LARLHDYDESEDEVGRGGICFSNGDGDFVDIPEGFTPETHKQFFSEIIDEVVMLMKDARDVAAYDCNIVCRVENNKLKQIIRRVERKYDLPDGTIKESTVLFRLKSYKKKKDHKFSRLKDIEDRLIIELYYDYKNKKFPTNPFAAFFGGNMIRTAKKFLTDEHPWGSGEQRYHHLAMDYVQLDEDWRRDFLTRNYDAFVKKGIHVLGFPGALEFHENHGWDRTKWNYELDKEFDEKRASFKKSNTTGKSNEKLFQSQCNKRKYRECQ